MYIYTSINPNTIISIMKKIMYLVLVWGIMSILFTTCNEPKQSGVDILFTFYSLEETFIEWDYNTNEKILVINSDDEKSNYVTGDYSEIDFSKKHYC